MSTMPNRNKVTLKSKAKAFEAKSPNGTLHVYEIKYFNKFCRLHSLHESHMRDIGNGGGSYNRKQHQGWTMRWILEEEYNNFVLNIPSKSDDDSILIKDDKTGNYVDLETEIRKYPGYVYFIVDLFSNAVKIGYTDSHPKARRNTLQTGNPNEIYLIKYIPGSYFIEQLYKNTLHKFRYSLTGGKEWFRLTDDVIMFCQIKEELENLKSNIKSKSLTSSKSSPLIVKQHSKPAYHEELINNSNIEEYNLSKYM